MKKTSPLYKILRRMYNRAFPVRLSTDLSDFSNGQERENSSTVANWSGNYAANLYSKMPCLIGFNYLRVKVDGAVIPCCTADHFVMGNIVTQNLPEIWFSSEYESFRQGSTNLPNSKAHLSDPKWTFCQQCPHTVGNIVLNAKDTHFNPWRTLLGRLKVGNFRAKESQL